jgi:hypothetical protein
MSIIPLEFNYSVALTLQAGKFRNVAFVVWLDKTSPAFLTLYLPICGRILEAGQVSTLSSS